jgi:DNA-binding response OmpR family regulator
MSAPDPPNHRATILVADDIAANRNLLRETLEPQGYEVLLVESGETALKIARRTKPDVILLDINMPGIDGHETCRCLKAEPVTSDIPVIFISANEGTQNLVEGFRAGGIDYISKPFKTEEVLIRVETHLKVNRLTLALVQKNEQLTALNAELQAEITRRQQAEQSLSLIEEQRAERFHTGGTLRPDAPSYVERRADKELLAALRRGEFCYVLTSRQMGKSSLMVRTAKFLREEGCLVVSLDLTAIGQNLTPDQWYLGLLSRMGWQLELEEPLEKFWLTHERLGPAQRFFRAIREIVLGKLPVVTSQSPVDGNQQQTTNRARRTTNKLVIFVDELDVVRSLPFRTDEFFAAIREQYNRRAEDPALNQLTFCLLGVATPSDLIQDIRMTPFNIGQRIELEDFALGDVAPLSRGLGRDPKTAAELMERIYYWTRGHPYLTQMLCKAVVSDESVQTAAALDDLSNGLFLTPQAAQTNDNLLFVRERLLRSEGRREILQLYARIRSGEAVCANDSDQLFHALRLAGITRVADGTLRVRNRIYEEVFNQTWVSDMMARNS